MSDAWQRVIRSLMYGLEYERDLPGRAARMFEVVAMAPAEAVAPPEDMRRALDDALASSVDLTTLYPQSYSDSDLRGMFAALSEKLRREFAKSGEPAPQTGAWRPTEDDEHAGVALNAGDALPSDPAGWWRLIREA